jgi:hypothetical protein
MCDRGSDRAWSTAARMNGSSFALKLLCIVLPRGQSDKDRCYEGFWNEWTILARAHDSEAKEFLPS